ncbi:MAG: isoleucine--tRNA ligase [Bdellovibrionota bacterium]
MKPVSTDISFPKLEQQILAHWRAKSIFERSTDPNLSTHLGGDEKGETRKSYIFYDGPPFATGLPHYGHLLAGTIKDVVGRFFTMKGYHVDRRFGWDCHGVPIEFEIQKSLNLHGAKAIREFGVGKFNEECRKIVLRYTKEWRLFVERSGRWVDFNREYRTMDKDFMESIWWVMRSLWNRGLIYEGLKCVAYSCGMNTPLSNFEANLNYKNVQDPAVTVRAVLRGNPAATLGVSIPSGARVVCYIWTTTPWTLPSNMALAVGNQIRYSIVHNPKANEVVIVASSLAPSIFPGLQTEAAHSNGTNGTNGTHAKSSNGEGAEEQHPTVLGTVTGEQLVGLEYDPFFAYYESEREHHAFRIYPGDFVADDEGTGIVHLASFGEEDLAVFKKHNIAVVDPLDEDGVFQPVIKEFAGLHFKAADPKVIAALKERGLLVSHKTIEHSYPFCWRTDTPLIYRSISSWFVRVESIKDLLQHANSSINWVPEHLRDGRFGKWLENARDWAISRDRFWGTPIPIWRCEKCDHEVCLGSVEELEKLSGATVTDLHSHFIDELTIACERCEARMRRIPQVLDCWFESGSMPYAQAHYPFEGKAEFEDNFPADFIAEGLDQTRGWFYTLLVLSTALFGQTSFRNVVVNGIVLAEDGKKMSKSLKNYPPPDEVMDELGADAMRLYLLSSPATRAEDLRFSKEGVKQVVRQTLLPLWNAYNFFVTYALVDDWTPEKIPAKQSENLLDRWILSKVASLVEGVDSALSTYHLYAAAQPILEFVDQLTNWYIRLNRRRFWVGNRGEELEDKLHAYATLHTALLSFVRVLAPLAPFVSEEIFLNLSKGMKGFDRESVHLCPFPKVSEVSARTDGASAIDEALEHAMELFEEVILLGRALRNDHNLKVRQPLGKLTIIYPEGGELENLKRLDSYVREELNVKSVEYSTDEREFVSLKARLNTKLLGKTLGPKLGRDGMRSLQGFVETLTTDQLKSVERGEAVQFQDIQLGREEILVERTVLEAGKAGGRVAASSGQITIVLDTLLTPELRLEGMAREFVNRVQKLRKDFNFDVTDRIVIRFMTACPRLPAALSEHKGYVMEETLAVELHEVKSESDMGLQGSSVHLPIPQEIEGKTVIIGLTRMQG